MYPLSTAGVYWHSEAMPEVGLRAPYVLASSAFGLENGYGVSMSFEEVSVKGRLRKAKQLLKFTIRYTKYRYVYTFLFEIYVNTHIISKLIKLLRTVKSIGLRISSW